MNISIIILRLLPLCFITLLCLTVPFDSEAAETQPSQLNIVKIAENDSIRPSTIAWTSDGATIAFTTDSLKLYRLQKDSIHSTGIKNVLSIASGSSNLLYVLYEDNGIRKLTSLDTETMQRKDIPIDLQPDGIFFIPDNRGLLFITARLTQAKLWAELDYSISVFDMSSYRHKTIYTSKRTITGKAPMSDHQTGWLLPGIRPSETELLTIEYVKPPVLLPYLRIGLSDFITGKSREIGHIDHRKMSIPASWSPDGSRFAFPDMQDSLSLYNIRDKTTNVISADIVTGTYPAWNPAGSQIYFGGYIINSDGSGIIKLFDNAKKSIGVWSPDGKMLTVSLNNNLYLIRDFNPYLISPDKVPHADILRKKILLKDLLRENLISEKEFIEKYESLNKE